MSDDGSRVLIADHTTSSNAGSARVYQLSDGAWSQLGSTISGSSSEKLGFDAKISGNGNVLILACKEHASIQGRIAVYELSESEWSLRQSIVAPFTTTAGVYSVAISQDGSVIAAGTPFGNSFLGYLKKYTWGGSSYTNSLTITPVANRVGYYLDMDNTGAYLVTGNGESLTGPVRVYETSTERVLESSAANYSVAMSGDGLTVAAGKHHTSPEVTVHKRVDGTWTRVQTISSKGNNGVYVGTGLSLSNDGTYLIVGTYTSNMIDIYKWNGSSYSLVLNLEGTNEFGRDVGISSSGTKFAVARGTTTALAYSLFA